MSSTILATAKKTVELPRQTRAAEFAVSSFNADDNTIEVVWTTGASVRRRSWLDGPYDEELIVEDHAVRLGRLNRGAPFLNTHRDGSIGDVIGSVVPGSARIQNGKGVARIRLSTAAGDADEVGKIKDGTVRNISVGYAVHRVEKVEVNDGSVPVLRVVDWEPLEISAVPVPADPGAQTRVAESFPCEIIDKTSSGGASTRQIKLSAEEARSFQKVGDRNNIRSLIDMWIDEGLDREAIGRRAIDELARRDADSGPFINCIGDPTVRGISMTANAETLDNPNFVRKSIEDALYARMTGKQPEGAAREFIGRRLDDLDNILAETRGEKRSWLDKRSGGFHTTSDFPNLLTGAGNRVLQDAYQAASSPLVSLARVRNATDHRPVNVLRLSESAMLQKVNEAGEVTYGSRGEEREAFKVETFARIFSLSRQAWNNDDLGAFADFNTAGGRAAAETVAGQLVALFTANSGDGATLADGNPLFHAASRKNKAASGTVIDINALAAARQALRETKGLDGVTPIGLTPKYLVVSPAKETQAEQTLSAILANQVSNANPFASKLELLVEPRFTGNAWRVFSDTQAVLSIAYLNGARGPMLEQREGWTTLGVEFRAVLDFGCGITDWRGAYLNAGA